MILADTSVWIEFLKGNIGYLKEMGRLIEEQQLATVECVFGELLQGAKNQREKNILTGYFEALPKIDEREIWLEAGLLSFKGKWITRGVGLIDLAIVSAARKNGLKVWTLDKKLKTVLGKDEIFQP